MEWLIPVGVLALLIGVPLVRGMNAEIGGARGWGRLFGGPRK